MRTPNPLTFDLNLGVALSDFYEWSMAHANIVEHSAGKPSVFDFVVRKLPTNKVTGSFQHEGVRYDKLEQRAFLINAGLEQATSYILEGRGSPAIADYLRFTQGITDSSFLSWAQNHSFAGDVWGMKEGTVFFAHEPQLRVHASFEDAQLYESLLLATINPQTAVATLASDLASVTDKILLEGGSRRATSPQSALFNTRAALIGGFHATSNVAHGMRERQKVGGTHGHSYVMLHETEREAFAAQAALHEDRVTFLLDTYDVKSGLETALSVIDERRLSRFGFRLDSGDIAAQATYLHERLADAGYTRSQYTLVASDDLTAPKIAALEAAGADIDKYLVGTYAVNPPKPVPGVYKLAGYATATGFTPTAKQSEDAAKSTLPGIKQVYRVSGSDGYFRRDIIGLQDEDVSGLLKPDETVEPLLTPIITQGRQVYDFPALEQIRQYRSSQLARFRDIDHYEVCISPTLDTLTQRVRHSTAEVAV